MPNTVRKPTADLNATGAFERNPARSRPHEPNTGRGIGPAPAHLTDIQRAIWDELVGNCASGVFQSSDRMVMECLCILVAQLRANPAGFGGRTWATMQSLLARCGMTPSDRSRVTVSPSEQKEKPKVGLASFRK